MSHMTGIGTQIGFSLGKNEWIFSAELLLIPVFFILGSFISGAITSARIDRNLKPKYELVILAKPVVIFILLLTTSLGLFGSFDSVITSLGKSFLSLSLATLCGLQNGCFATMTKGQIRTTHLTGISTDLGTDLARLAFGKLSLQESRLVHRTNISRVATFASFASGAVVSALISDKLGYNALIIPGILSLAIYHSVTKISRSIDLKYKNSNIALNLLNSSEKKTDNIKIPIPSFPNKRGDLSPH